MSTKKQEHKIESLPQCARVYIDLVIRKMGYRRKIRLDVQRELEAHFADALQNITDENEKSNTAEKLIAVFGDPKLLAALLRRGKKRCRPLWAKSLLRFAQALGIFFILFILYSIWFMTGKPAIRVDYIQRWNQMNQSQIQPQDSAWPDYEKAIELYERFSVGNNQQLWDYHMKYDPGWNSARSVPRQKCEEELPQELRNFEQDRDEDWRKMSDLQYDPALMPEDLRQKAYQWATELEPAWNLVRQGSAKSYLYRPVFSHESDDGILLSVLLPHLGPLRRLAIVGVWQSRLAVQKGNDPQAMDDCLAILRLGHHLRTQKCLIEQLVGFALTEMGHQEILRIIPLLDSHVLSSLQQQLAAIYPPNEPLLDIEAERMMFLDTVQRVFSEGGPGGGHLVPKAMIQNWLLISSVSGQHRTIPPESDNVWMELFTLPSGLAHAGRTETISKGMEYYDRAKEIAKHSPFERKAKQMDLYAFLYSLPRYRYSVIHRLAPALERAGTLAFQKKALHDAVQTIVALKRWNLDKGDYPASLSDLVAGGYLDKEPDDPYAAGPLRYEKRGDDFILYSLGADFDDDGGVQGPGDDLWGEKKELGGDRLFWPLP